MREAKGLHTVNRAELEMGDGPPSLTWLDRVISLGPGVVVGESQAKVPTSVG